MFKIIQKQIIAEDIKRIDVAAADIAAKVQPGQFVMLTPASGSAPVPLTVVDADHRRGMISFIVHEVGPRTRMLGGLSIGDTVHNIVGPLGKPSFIDKYGLVICVATGIGAAQILPICRALKKKGNKVIGIIGAKSKKVLMLEAQMRVVCDEIFISTNDGSYERKALASQLLQELLAKYKVNAVYAIGSADMMEAASRMAAAKNIPVRVTVNPYMTNGLGMCGSCRVRMGDSFALACTEGPEFDGSKLDFKDVHRRDQAIQEKQWDKKNRPASIQDDGLKTFVKSFWDLVKSKT